MFALTPVLANFKVENGAGRFIITFFKVTNLCLVFPRLFLRPLFLTAISTALNAFVRADLDLAMEQKQEPIFVKTYYEIFQHEHWRYCSSENS
jgi:hypothetical protein